MFWMKIVTSFLLGIFFHLFRAQQFYFFNNLGYTKTRLYIAAGILDLSVWLALILIVILFI